MLDTDMPGRAARESAARLAEAVVCAFNQAQVSTPRLSCHILFDPSLWSPQNDALLASLLAKANDTLTPITWSHPNLVPAHRPLLMPVHLHSNTGSVMLHTAIEMAMADMEAQSLRSGQGQRVCGVLFSDQNVANLASHLGQIAVQTLPDAGLPPSFGQRRLLRFFDPLVMPSLWSVSSQAQHAMLLGPVSTWMSLGFDHNWQTWVRPSPTSDTEERTLRPPARIWNAQQWRHLVALSVFNPVALELGLNESILDMRPRVLATLCRVMHLGVHEVMDLKAMARLALTQHPDFDQHPAVQRCLIHRAAGLSAAQALSDLNDSDWRDIQRELRSN